MKELEERIKKNKEIAGGKSSKDCTLDEAVRVYLASKRKEETAKERLDRINAFRCGW